jgi:autotransporter-associated beta strand protein
MKHNSALSIRNSISLKFKVFGVILVLLLSSVKSWGQVLWSNPTGTDWLNTASWTGGAVPTSTDIAQFGVNPTPGTAVGMSLSAATQQVGAIEMTSERTSALTIGNSGTSLTGTLQINGATVNSVANTIIRNNSSSLLTIQNNSAGGTSCNLGIALTNTTNNIIDGTGNTTINSTISGACPLTKTGTGILTLSASNTYTGVNAIQEGKVIIGNNAALGTNNTSNYVTISNGATLDLNGKTAISGSARGANINGTGISGSGAIMNSSSTTAIISGLIALQSASSIIGETGLISFSKTGPFMTGAFGLTLGGSQGGSIAGTIAGITSLTKIGSGTWTLSGTNTFTGISSIQGGKVIIGNNAALGANNVSNAGYVTISNGATLDLNGKTISGSARGATISGTGISGGGAIMNSGGAASIEGAITLAS